LTAQTGSGGIRNRLVALFGTHIRQRPANAGHPRTANPDVRFVTATPAVVIEILSPEDNISDYRARIADYRQKGISGIWIVDPKTRKGWDCSSGNWIETVLFRLPDSPVYLDLSAVR
jgi:Uma2 family endonuclease